MSLIPADWELPQELRSRIGASVGRQRTMQFEEHLMLLLHDVPAPDQDRREGIILWRDPQGHWQANSGESGVAALEDLLTRYENQIEAIDQAEFRAKQSEDYWNVLEALAPIARSSKNLFAVLQEARKCVPNVTELIDLRDRAYDLSRTAELTYQYAKASMDVAVVKRAEEQAEASDRMAVASHRLNMMAALFFPLATLSSVFGTSLTDGWTWSKTSMPFIVFLVSGVVTGIWFALFVSSSGKSK